MNLLSRSMPLAAALVALSLSGCSFFVDGQGSGGGASTPSAPVGPKAAAKKKDALDEKIEQDERYSYNPIGKRDPFRSFLNFEGVDGPGPGTLPTQKFEIDQYTLAGIIWGVDRPRALVEDPDGMGHVLEIGTYIGKNWGKVTQVTSGEVIVTEEYQTLDGELVVNNISLTLPVGDNAAMVQ